MLHSSAYIESSDVEARAKTIYNKLPGVLTFTNTRILWTEDGHTKPTVNIAHSKLKSMFASKAGIPKKRLRLHEAGLEVPYQFSFTSPGPIAETELDNFKRLLAAVVSNNTDPTSSGTSKPLRETNSIPSSPLPIPSTPYRASPSPYSPASSAGVSKKGGRFVPEIYSKVLIKNPQLAELHRILVEGKQITEQEFWEGREYLLDSEAATLAQKKGKPSEILVPKLHTTEDGKSKLSLTAQTLADIFEEFPIVADAYAENVPPLTAAEFWERYFSSKLFDRHRASSRNSVAKDDTIFDRYLEREDDGVEPLHSQNQRVQLFIDLGATEADHVETGNDRDLTMRPGGRKNAIPVIRRFNEHSERLLQSALGQPSTFHYRGNDPHDLVSDSTGYQSQLDLNDLHPQPSEEGISLNVQNAQHGFAGAQTSASTDKGKADAGDVVQILQKLTASMSGWSERLETFILTPQVGDAAIQDMGRSILARVEARQRKDEIPQFIMQQITTLATATNEFLRQFWSALYPPFIDDTGKSTSKTLANASPAQRDAKMLKMINYLRLTREKTLIIYNAAPHAGVEVKTLETIFAPLLASVERALTVYESSKSR